jgi:hypothetical protein
VSSFPHGKLKINHSFTIQLSPEIYFPKGGVRWFGIEILSGVMDVVLKSVGSQ